MEATKELLEVLEKVERKGFKFVNWICSGDDLEAVCVKSPNRHMHIYAQVDQRGMVDGMTFSEWSKKL